MEELPIVVSGFPIMEWEESLWPEDYLKWATSQIVISVAGFPNQPIVIQNWPNTRASRW